MADLTLAIADQIANATLAEGRNRKANPLTVTVLDAGGHVVVTKREDGSGILRCEIALGKAWGALGMGLPSDSVRPRRSEPEFLCCACRGIGGADGAQSGWGPVA